MRPNEVRELVFLHRDKKLGKFLTVYADETGPLEVRLEPCGSITGRLVDKTGQPSPNSLMGWIEFRIGRVIHRGWPVATDQNGRFETALVPRVGYSFGRRQPAGEIVLQPGETKDFGDVHSNNNRPVPSN
jgi:hypothetical protein